MARKIEWMQQPVQLWQANAGDGATITQADVDKAIKDALESARADFDDELKGLKDKNRELLGKLRATTDIKPEDVAALEAQIETLKADNAKLAKEAKDATKAAETATKALETEQGAARSYAVDAEINGAIASGNVTPALVPAFTAMVKGQAKADLVDGKYVVMIGDKPASEHIKSILDSDDGKYFKAAAANGGGGAPGGGGTPGSKTVTREQFDAMSHVDRSAFAKDGGKVVDQV